MRPKKLIESLMPFLAAGFAIAVLIGFFIVLSYVLIWGLVIGGGLWLGMMMKEKLFPSPKRASSRSHHSDKGRIIEHDET